MIKKKKYSAEDKFKYHFSRDMAPGRFNLKYGGSKHCYSFGFCDAFDSRNNYGAVKREFGKKSALAYNLGRIKGQRASNEYLEKTGKQPSMLKFK